MFSLRASSPFGGHPPPLGQRSSVTKKIQTSKLILMLLKGGTGHGERARGTGKGYIFPFPGLVPRSPFPVLVTSDSSRQVSKLSYLGE